MPGELLVAITLLAYALGCVNTGYYLVRVRTGRDLRRQGSGTAGALNTGRVLGRGAFATAMAGDVLKGVAAVALAGQLAPGSSMPALAAVAVVAGHIYPAQLGFRGGKGLATTFGATVTLMPTVAAAAVGATLAWLVVTRRPVPAGLVGVASLPAAALAIRGADLDTLAGLAIATMVLIRHASVISALLRRPADETTQRTSTRTKEGDR